ncbi:MAG: PAS domain S-box protein [Syntrophomonadaceae bacterium]|nr:PAS domain S-box protein [Syntrophomonadaceae bacterium]
MSEKHSGSIEKELRLAREQLHRFTGAINSCSDAIRITDMQGKLLYQNAAFTNMFGYTSEELNRSGGIRAVYDDPDMYSYVLRTALERQNWQGKVKMRHRDGHSLMIDIQTNTVHDVTGNTIGLVGVHHDITPIQEAEAALEFLSRTAMGFVELSLEENLFAYIARELNNLVHNAIVIVSSFDSNNNRFTIRALNANENWVKVLEEGLGLPLLGLETRADENFLKKLQESRLQKIQSGLYGLSYRLRSRQTCMNLEKKMEIEDIQVIGFTRRGTLLGTASLLVVRGGRLASPGLIETFANQASVAIERRRVEDQLLEREKQLAVTLESIGEGVIAVDTMGKIQLLNPAAETITGWSSHEAREQPLVKVFPLLDPASNSSGKLMAFKDFLPEDGSGERRFQNLTLLCDNQVRKIIAGTISRMLGSNQQILGFTMVFQDITEQQQHQTQQALSQKLESIGQLAAGIAHEINTPMQYVGDNIYFMEDALSDLIPLVVEYRKLVNECELVGNKIELVREIHHREQQIDLDYLQEELPRALEQSREGIDRVRKLVLTMKDFAHPSSGIKAFADLNKGVQSTIQISINEWKYYAELQAELSPNLPLVYCVIDEINQAVLNLIVNSTHAIRDAVNTGRYTKGLIQVKTRQEGDDVAIEIADNGGGIPAEVKYLIFDPFFTTKDVGKGTGQGLTITHDIIVNKHGGRITLESEENKGTRFTLYLPVKEEVGSDE